jgi:hypothetical protein
MFPRRPAFASCGQYVRWESLGGSCVRAHLESLILSLCSFHLDLFIRLLSQANYGLHPTVLDLAMVVGDYRVELTWSLPLLLTTVTVRSEFIHLLLQFVIAALLGSG